MNQQLTFRLATANDLVEIVQMLADDPLGSMREKLELPLPEAYIKAFERIIKDSNQELTLAELNGKPVGTFQLTFIQYLTHQGGLRAQIEAVRVHSTHRGKGIGTAMFTYAIERAREQGCYMLQLTTDKQRPKAVHFYESLGFVATHEGMKLNLR
ncbi:GNAT family N-acetyltransferase [Spirosoma sp. SC4-14]|uniref:GNAT family N-acetyltransferase n=1 Tax=Spirosoma sp. SC4-14 TaxID=3128900 RepID=UPI0030CB1638